MAVQGKKINELTAIGTVSDETVLPAVYVSGTTVNSTANKISIEQISTKVQDDMSTTLAGKQDTLVSGTNIKTVNGNSLLGSGNVDIDLPDNVYTEDNLLPGNNITFTSANNIVIASNFGNLSYVQTTAIQKEQTSTLVIETKFARTGDSLGDSAVMGYILNVSNLFGIGIQGGPSPYLRWYYKNGSSVFSSTSFATTLNKEYYLRCTLSSSLIKVEISEDKVNYTTIINYTSSHLYTSETSYMQLGGVPWNTTTDYFVGKIWLSDTKVYVDNVSILDLSNSSDYTITGSPTIQTIPSGNVVINAIDPLPSQSGQSGKFLTTDGTNASWAQVSTPESGADTSLSNLTNEGKEVASSMSFPGDSRISLTVPQPKELITATSDGYMSAGTSAESMQLFVFPPTATSTDDDAMTNTLFAASSIQAARGSVCIRKGQKFAYTTADNSSLSWLRFCPSKGSEQ